MTVQRRHTQNRRSGDFDNRETVVTYSRLASQDPGSLHGVDGREPAGPLYEAVEVPHIDRPPPHEPYLSEADLRAERDYGPGLDPLEPEKRNRGFRYLIFVGVGVIALAAGVGVLVATVGSSSRIDTAAPDAVPASEGVDAASVAPDVRAIPLGEEPGGPEIDLTPAGRATPADPAQTESVTPPAPRPRPDHETDTAAVTPEPVEPIVAEAAAPAATEPPEAASAPAGDADFIRRIEQTLSGIGTKPAPGTVPADPTPTEPVAAATASLEPPAPDAIASGDTDRLPVRVLPDGTVVFEEEAIILEEEAVVVDEETFDEEAAALDGGGHFDFEMESPPAAAAVEAAPAIPAVPEQPLVLDGVAIDLNPEPLFVPPEDIPSVPATIGLE
ncbi:MAG: hypothetical protein GY798_23075 [Hyphomicrobiales bacterium]|nr:hypothetical protein [Hyphomicrobiales bacterium]